MLLTASGAPVAPPAILRALAAIDPRLALRYLPPTFAQTGTARTRGTWAFVLRWREDDPRRALIRRGELAADSDFEYLGEIPLDCAVDEAEAYFVRYVGRYREGDVARLRERLAAWNAHQAEANAEAARDVAADALDRVKHIPEVAAALGGGTVITSSTAGQRTGSDVTQRTGRSAAEYAAAFRDQADQTPSPYATEAAFVEGVRAWLVAETGGAADAVSPELVHAVQQILVLQGAVIVQPPVTEAADRALDFAERMRQARARKAAREADARGETASDA